MQSTYLLLKESSIPEIEQFDDEMLRPCISLKTLHSCVCACMNSQTFENASFSHSDVLHTHTHTAEMTLIEAGLGMSISVIITTLQKFLTTQFNTS